MKTRDEEKLDSYKENLKQAEEELEKVEEACREQASKLLVEEGEEKRLTDLIERANKKLIFEATRKDMAPDEKKELVEGMKEGIAILEENRKQVGIKIREIGKNRKLAEKKANIAQKKVDNLQRKVGLLKEKVSTAKEKLEEKEFITEEPKKSFKEKISSTMSSFFKKEPILKIAKPDLSTLSIDEKVELIKRYLEDIRTYYVKKEIISTKKDMPIKNAAVSACNDALTALSKRSPNEEDILKAVKCINTANDKIGKTRGVFSLGGFWEKKLSEIEKIVFSIPEVSRKLNEERVGVLLTNHKLK